MSLLGPKVSLFLRGNEKAGWGLLPRAWHIFYYGYTKWRQWWTLQLGDCLLCTLDVRVGKLVYPPLIFDSFFNVICSNSSFYPFIYWPCDICLIWMSWLLDCDIVFVFDVQFLLLCPNFGQSGSGKLSPSPFKLFRIFCGELICFSLQMIK